MMLRLCFSVSIILSAAPLVVGQTSAVVSSISAVVSSITGSASTPTATSSTSSHAMSSASVTAITGCHLHGSTQYCMAGSTEYEIMTTLTATRTQDLPAQYTGCHNHGSELYCVAPNGDDVRVRAEGANASTAHGSSGVASATAMPSGSASGASATASPTSTPASGGSKLDGHSHAGVPYVAAAAAALVFLLFMS